MLLLFLLQLDVFQLIKPLERYPALLSLIYLAGIAFVVFVLVLFVAFNRRRKSPLAVEPDENLPEEVRRRLGARSANRALWVFRIVFVVLAFSVFGFHVYWALYAAEKDPRFAVLEKRDIRVKRVSKSQLSGWILDRDGDLKDAFAYWKIEKKRDQSGREDEDLARVYPLDKEMAHLLGTERGTPGLEYNLFRNHDEPTPEALEVLLDPDIKKDENRDVRLTIDHELQRFAHEQLKDKRGAIVVLNPQNGEVLAVASNPAYSLYDAQDPDKFRDMDANQRDRPLVSRAMREYYVPGSTFKLFTMIGAFRSGRQNEILNSSPGGYVPYRNSRSITDANGGCEPPFGCGPINILQAFEASSNQYFSQMAVLLGRDRMAETARLFGIEPVDKPEDALTVGFFPDIWNATSNDVKNAVALRKSTMVTGKEISLYDLAIQGMGQGYAGQMTPFQMALVAAAAGNANGNLMKPKIELERAPEVFSNLLNPSQAQQVRAIMARVTEEPGGTARSIMPILGAGIRVGGKTGTAQKQVPVYDPKTNKPKFVVIKRRNRKTGEITEIKRTVLQKRVDGWFIAIAPLENPQVAIAVVVEGIGNSSGGRTAAPLAANMIVKARHEGLLGEGMRTVPTNNQPINNKPQPNIRRR
ncbi:MAG: penicillin-binding transpeptidase domain-containing protein [Acidobacteriota bacterium]|nr:penicillin-binding transpeptidase domain-containing protein [Acidobacteriota bacterium]